MRTILSLVSLLILVLVFSACNQERQSQTIEQLNPPTAIGTPATVQPLLPPLTLTRFITPSTESAMASPLPTNTDDAVLVKYQDRSGYGIRFPNYEILYDPTIWEFRTEITESNDRLVYRNDSRCSLILNLGGNDAPSSSLGFVSLAGRQWSHWISFDNRLGYATPFDGIAYYFDILLPEKYDEKRKSLCQQLAEEVIDTFLLVD